jgi:hypothetical protein
MSDYTSFVAVCEEIRTDPDGNPVRVEVPVNMPVGVSYEGVFGEGYASTGMSLGRGQSVGGLTTTCAQPSLSPVSCDAEELEDGLAWDDGSYVYEVSWYGTVSLASASPTLGMLPSEVRGAVRELLDEITEAYQSFLDGMEDADEWPTGLVSFSVTVNSIGAATSVSVAGEGLDASLDAEICGILEGMILPAPPEGSGTIVVQLDFVKTY